jgi:hypothetical protein
LFPLAVGLYRDGRRLTGNAGGNDDNVSASEGLPHAIVGGEVALDLGDGGDVRKVGGHAGGVDDVVEGELVDERAGLEEEGQRLRGSVSEMVLPRALNVGCSPVRYHQRHQRRLL